MDIARALADRAELALVLDDGALGEALRAELGAMGLTEDERAAIAGELVALDRVETWFA